MSTMKSLFRFAVVCFALGLFMGCGSTDGGGGGSTSVYYGVGFYDPWYYGHYDHDHDHDIVVTPPTRPDRPNRPERPVNLPAQVNTPRPTPSIPSMPRGGGGGRRR